jgi:anti-sigma28 factor (negative regulator of flagellin synthesis)
MMIKNPTPINATEAINLKKNTAESADAKAASGVSDRVSVEDARQAQDLVAAVRANAGTDRGLRLAQIEAQVRAGTYRPDTVRLADSLLAAAEIDARLAAMMRT